MPDVEETADVTPSPDAKERDEETAVVSDDKTPEPVATVDDADAEGATNEPTE